MSQEWDVQADEQTPLEFYEDLKVLEQLGQHVDDEPDYEYMLDSDDVDLSKYSDNDLAYLNAGWTPGLDY